MPKQTRTIYRVVGGGDPRKIPSKDKTMVHYGIIPYLLVHEVPSGFWIAKDGLMQFRARRNTSNSEYCDTLDEALDKVLCRLKVAIEAVQTTSQLILELEPQAVERLHHVKFRCEVFYYEKYFILKKTKKAWMIEPLATREKTVRKADSKLTKIKTVAKGRQYFYAKDYQSKPHNPEMPSEEWLGTSLETIQKLVELYARERIKHLQRETTAVKRWAKDFERTHDQWADDIISGLPDEPSDNSSN